MKQLSFFPEENTDPRAPVSTNWNLWHGCTKVSAGCMHCYMYRRDESIGKDPSIVQKTENFDLPVKVLKSGKNKGRYKIPYGSHIYTCFSSDFFHPCHRFQLVDTGSLGSVFSSGKNESCFIHVQSRSVSLQYTDHRLYKTTEPQVYQI